MRFQLSIIIIVCMICAITTQSTSIYKGVTWHKPSKKWYVRLQKKGEKRKCGEYFNDELDAAKKINQLCEEFGIPAQNPGISAIPNQKKNEKTSQYKGVYLNKKTGKWYVQLQVKGEKKNGGYLNDELDAAKRANQLCEEFRIPPKNPGISAIPNQQSQKKQKTSQYKGVSFNTKTGKWRVQLPIKGGKTRNGGYFNDELDAAKKVNQLCEEFGIPTQNPAISAIPNQKHGDYPQTFANPVVSSEILKINTDEEKKTKRKRKTELNDDNELPSQQKYYFYEHLLN